MTKRQLQALQALERRLNYQFKNFDLLQEAMSHSSLEGAKNNERLEFLGDGVLNLVVAEYLIAHFPHVQEGKLSRMRAQLVCKEALAKVAAAYSISDALILGPSEARGGSQQRKSIMADAVEAIIGAVFQESGYEVAKEAILRWFGSLLADLSLDLAAKDPKTRLQEYCQRHKYALPSYCLIEEQQKDGDTYFSVKAEVEELNLESFGDGSSRKKAEQKAAQSLLDQICD